MANDHYSAWDHKEWSEANLKDFGDYADCVEYINCEDDYGDCERGDWYYADDDTLTVYAGTFGNYNSPGADSYTFANVYDDVDEYRAALAKLEACDEYLPREEEEEDDSEEDDDSEPDEEGKEIA